MDRPPGYPQRVPRTLNEAFGPYAKLSVIDTSPRHTSGIVAGVCVVLIVVLAIGVRIWV